MGRRGDAVLVASRADNFIQRIKCIRWSSFYLLGSDLSSKASYPSFEQPGPGGHDIVFIRNTCLPGLLFEKGLPANSPFLMQFNTY